MPRPLRKWHKQFSFAKRELCENERVWARDCSVISRPNVGSSDIKFELGKEYRACSPLEMYQILSQSNNHRRCHSYETLTDEMRHTCFYYYIDLPAPAHTHWNHDAARFIINISIRYFVRHLRSAFSSITRLDVDETNIVCVNASSASRISWLVIFRKVIFYDHHVSMREYIEEAMIGLYTELRQLRRQLTEQKAPNELQRLIDVAISHGIINSTMYTPIQTIPVLGASGIGTQQSLRVIATQSLMDPDHPVPESMKFSDDQATEFPYSFEQWHTCLVHQPDSFVVNRYAIRLWPRPDSICTQIARKTYPEGYQDLPYEERYVSWAPKFSRHSRTVWDRMKQEVIDDFRQRLLTIQNQPAPNMHADSIEGDRAVVRDDGTRWRAQDLEEGDSVFCPLHQAREGEIRAILFTCWLSTLAVDRIRAEAVIYPSRFRPGFSNGRVVFCTGACKRMISIIEIPEQVPFQNDPTSQNKTEAAAAPILENSDHVTIPNRHGPITSANDKSSLIISDGQSQDQVSRVSNKKELEVPHIDLNETRFTNARLIVIEGSENSGKTSVVAAHLNVTPASDKTLLVLTTTMARARTMAAAYNARCYADPDVCCFDTNNHEWTANVPVRCTVAFDHIAMLAESLSDNTAWHYVVIEDAFFIYLLQQFGLANESEPNLQALIDTCSSASVVYALSDMIPASVIDFIGRVLCRFDPDIHPDLLQVRHISGPEHLVPICCYHRIVDLFDHQIVAYLDHFDEISGMSALPAVTFCTSAEFAKLLQWILQQICHQYGNDSRRIRTYLGAEENRDSVSSERFNIAQALQQADELLVTSLLLSGYTILQFFQRHFTYFHDGVFSNSTLLQVENRIREFGNNDSHLSRHLWYRPCNTGFGPLNSKRISQAVALASNKKCPPRFVDSRLPNIAELSNDITAYRGTLPDDWLPSDFKYSADASPMHRLRWLYSTICGYFDLQKTRSVPEWTCEADLRAIKNDFDFDVALEGLLRAAASDGTTSPSYNNNNDKAPNTRQERQNMKRSGTRRSV